MTDLKPYISEWAFVPLSVIGNRLGAVKSKLTVYPRQFGDAAPAPIRCYDLKTPGYIGLPIEWALDHYQNLGFEDRTVIGGECYYNHLPDPNHERAAPGQAQFMADLDAAAEAYFTVLAKAATGSGKTVTFLRTAAKRGRRTLILVHLQRLARQWADEIHDKLGIPYDDIGWVQGDVCNYDHPFVVGVTNSVAERAYPKAFYQAFGTVGFDEGHRLGAPMFSQVIGKFPAQCKVMLTATDKRKDGCDKVFHYYFGQPKVRASQPAMLARVHSLTYPCSVPGWCTLPAQIAMKLAEDDRRNALLVQVIGKLYRLNRQILVIGDSVEHLQHLITLSVRAGIPVSVLGLYVNEKYTGTSRQKFSKVKSADVGDRLIYWKPTDGSEPAFAYQEKVRVLEVIGGGHVNVCAANEGRIPNRTEVVHLDELRKLPVFVPVMSKISNEELDYIKAHAQIFYATYGMLKEGIDIPRLDAGIDVTPRADAEQVIGRIRRPMPGKPEPVWYTIKDVGNAITVRSWKSRVRDYRGSNCVVIEHGQVG